MTIVESIIELVVNLCDLLLHWRFFLALALAATAIWIVFTVTQDQETRWLLSVPIGLVGILGGVWWQMSGGRS